MSYIPRRDQSICGNPEAVASRNGDHAHLPSPSAQPAVVTIGPPKTLVWFRQDLRLTDNPALVDAVEHGGAVIPVFILDDDTVGRWRPGAAAKWWLHHSLEALTAALAQRGTRLILRRGPAAATLKALLAETGATAVVWNRVYEPDSIARDTAVKQQLLADGHTVSSHNGSLVREPWTLRTQSGGPFRVYTPFWKRYWADRGEIGPPLPTPSHLPAPDDWPASDVLADWSLTPTAYDWSAGLRAAWTPGEAGATIRLADFLDRTVAAYDHGRDRPGANGTSRLSPHLHWGEISPRQVWAAVTDRLAQGALDGHEGAVETFLKEIVWREFSYNLLYHFPKLPDDPLDGRFAQFPWDQPANDAGGASPTLRAWQRGKTGYPIVDAGMRQLWHIGWMHNRVRMIVASFLIKHLLIPWQVGEAWFWDTLVDADLASNAASWQWVAGCGADAAPYFRIFNPILQGEKFDPDGDYVRTWVPEIARLPNKYLHKPWEAPALAQTDAGVRLGVSYPHPIIDHKAARARALSAYNQIKGAA